MKPNEKQRSIILDCITAKYGFRFVVGWRPWQAAGGAPHCPAPPAKRYKLPLGQRVKIMRPMPGTNGPNAPSILNSLTVGSVGTVVEHYWPGKHLSGMPGRPGAAYVTNGFRVQFDGLTHSYDFNEREAGILARVDSPCAKKHTK